MEEEKPTHDIINDRYDKYKKNGGGDLEIDNIKVQIENTYKKYKFAKTRKVTKLTGDLFHDSGAVIIPGVYDALLTDEKKKDVKKVLKDIGTSTWVKWDEAFGEIITDNGRSFGYTLNDVNGETNKEWNTTGLRMLKNILLSICVYYSDIGLTNACYTQGMNLMVVKVLYLHSFNNNTGFEEDKEEECFWILDILLNSTKSHTLSFVRMGFSNWTIPSIKLASLFTLMLKKYVDFSYDFLIGEPDDPSTGSPTHPGIGSN